MNFLDKMPHDAWTRLSQLRRGGGRCSCLTRVGHSRLRGCGCLLLLLAALTARCDVMYWMVSQEGASSPIEFAYAQLVDGNGTAYKVADEDARPTEWTDVAPAGERSTGTATGETWMYIGGQESDWKEATFYVALYDNDATMIGKSSPFSYALNGDEFRSHVWTKDSPYKPSEVTPLTVSAFSAVPEPTGGALVLFGAALLALRRKNGSEVGG